MSINIDDVKRQFDTHKEAARALSITKVTLWKWIKAGKLKGNRLGREVLIEKTVVQMLIDERGTQNSTLGTANRL